MRIFVLAGVVVLALSSSTLADSKLKPDEVPEFLVRVRVVRFGGQLAVNKKFSVDLAGVQGTAEGSQWSTQLKFGRPQAVAIWPSVLSVRVPA
jgi:hypothetical protein